MARKEARSAGGSGANDAGGGGAPGDIDAAVAELYGGPLDSFVRRRDALARTLRSEGRRDDASSVRSLRKPKRLAWALDAARLANPTAVDDLAGAADAVADAQATGGDMRATTTRLREVQDALVEAAVEAARAADQRVDRSAVGLAVRAVASDPGALSELRSGRLVDVPAAGGLGGLDPAFGAEVAAARGGRRGREEDTIAAPDRAAPPARAVAAARRALERAETKADAADRRAREAAERAGAAGEEAREAERELAAATERAGAARRAAEDAQRDADTAAEERDEAAAALADARELVAELEQ